MEEDRNETQGDRAKWGGMSARNALQTRRECAQARKPRRHFTIDGPRRLVLPGRLVWQNRGMNISRNAGRLTKGEARALGGVAWKAFLDLVALALKKGFLLSDVANGAAIVEHPVTRARISLIVHDDDLPKKSVKVLREIFD